MSHDRDEPGWHSGVRQQDSLTTPAVVICEPQARRNIASWVHRAAEAGVALRPHVKGHKVEALLRHQLELGAPGIEVSRLTEIKEWFRRGVDCDYTLSWSWDRPASWEAAAKLVAEGVRLTVDVDGASVADGYAAAAVRHGVEFGVRIQVDTGLRGAAETEVLALAEHIADADGLRLVGLTAYRSVYKRDRSPDPRAPMELGRIEGAMLAALASEVASAQGFDVADLAVMCGSSATSWGAAEVDGVTEIAGGSYVLGDAMLAAKGHMPVDEVAVGVLTTVTGVTGADVSVDATTHELGHLSTFAAFPDVVRAETADGQLVISEVSATGSIGRCAGVDGARSCPLVPGQRIMLIPGSAGDLSADPGSVLVVDDNGVITGAWDRGATHLQASDDAI